MKLFISKKLNVSLEEAFKIQKDYYYSYGTTLFGLMRNYNCDPDEFLEFVHDINFDKIKKNQFLHKNISLLPGCKIVYTNGDENYARKILMKLGLNNIFFDIFDIRKAKFIPKPKSQSVISLLGKYRLKPEDCVYFEDLEKNLKTGFDLGMTTIHISAEDKKLDGTSFINFRFKTINEALDMINKSLSN